MQMMPLGRIGRQYAALARGRAITGDALQAMLGDVAQAPGGKTRAPVPTPPNLWEPYRTRRFANGEDLYASIGVPREDKAGA